MSGIFLYKLHKFSNFLGGCCILASVIFIFITIIKSGGAASWFTPIILLIGGFVFYWVSKLLFEEVEYAISRKKGTVDIPANLPESEKIKLLKEKQKNQLLTALDLAILENDHYNVYSPSFSFYLVAAGGLWVVITCKDFHNIFAVLVLIFIIPYFFSLYFGMGSRNAKKQQLNNQVLALRKKYDALFNFDETTHGTARWMDAEEKNELIHIQNKGLVFSYNRDSEELEGIDEKLSYRHLAMIAPTGRGKTQNYVLHNIIKQRNSSYIVTDPKGECYNLTSLYNQNHDVNTLLFEPLNSKRTEIFWNPIARVKNFSESSRIAETIIKQTQGEHTEPFWLNSATTVLACLIMLCKFLEDKEQREYSDEKKLRKSYLSLANVRILMTYNRDTLKKLFKELDKSGQVYIEFMNIYADADEKTMRNVKSSLATALKIYADDEIYVTSSRHNFDFSQLRKEKTIIYIVIPPNKISYASPYITLFYQQLLEYLGESDGLPVYLMLDEFGNLGYIPDFDKNITTLRNKKVSISMILQDLQQLKNVYKENWETIFNGGCVSKIFMAGLELETCKRISETLGKMTIRVINDTEGNSSNVGGGQTVGHHISRQTTIGEGQNAGKSYSSQERALMTSDEIRTMDSDRALFISDNHYPLMFETRMFKDTAIYKNYLQNEAMKPDQSDMPAADRDYIKANEVKVETLNEKYIDTELIKFED